MRINDTERSVLAVLKNDFDDYSDFCYANFASLVKRTKLDRSQVRRAARSLARKGLAEYGRGLWTDEGEMAGSGYCCTKAGAAFLATLGE